MKNVLSIVFSLQTIKPIDLYITFSNVLKTPFSKSLLAIVFMLFLKNLSNLFKLFFNIKWSIVFNL